MSEMIERVARALCESAKMNPDDAFGGWRHWTDEARAAIRAMRECTERMRLEGESMATFGIGRAIDDEAVPRVWRGMIDAALR